MSSFSPPPGARKTVKYLRILSLVTRGRGEGSSLKILKRTPKRYQDPVLWAWLAIYFSSKRYQFLHNSLKPVLFLRFNTRKGAGTVPTVDLLRLNTLRGTKTTFLTPKRYDKHSPFFLYRSSLPGVSQ